MYLYALGPAVRDVPIQDLAELLLCRARHVLQMRVRGGLRRELLVQLGDAPLEVLAQARFGRLGRRRPVRQPLLEVGGRLARRLGRPQQPRVPVLDDGLQILEALRQQSLGVALGPFDLRELGLGGEPHGPLARQPLVAAAVRRGDGLGRRRPRRLEVLLGLPHPPLQPFLADAFRPFDLLRAFRAPLVLQL